MELRGAVVVDMPNLNAEPPLELSRDLSPVAIREVSFRTHQTYIVLLFFLGYGQ